MLPVPESSNALVGKDGKPSTETHRFLKSVAAELNSQNAAKAAKVQTWEQSWFIEIADNKDYRVVVNAALARTITGVTTRSSTGTCTLTVRINATALGGTVNSVSTTEQTRTHTSANAVAVGDDIVFSITSNSAAENISVTLTGTLTLA